MATARTSVPASIATPHDRLMFQLLTNTYGNTVGVDVSLLLMVANATPNPVTALEMLTGLYEPLAMPTEARMHSTHYYGMVRVSVTEVNPLSSQPYRIEGHAVKTRYYALEEGAAHYRENGNSWKYDTSEEATETCTIAAHYPVHISENIALVTWERMSKAPEVSVDDSERAFECTQPL